MLSYSVHDCVFQVIFEDSGFSPQCEDCLLQMDRISDKALQHNGDSTLKDRYHEHKDRWLKLKLRLQNIHMNLEQVPEKWKQYHLK